MSFHHPETGATYIPAKTIKKMIGNTELLFHISIQQHDVKIHAITICGRDVFEIIDPEIRRDAYEEFRHQYLNEPA